MTPRVAAAADTTPTFTKDIAPIFQEKCEACHRPDSIAPMSLVTYEEARPWARSIRSRVEARQMPPWNIDKTVGIQNFKNDRSLSRRADRHHRELGRRRRAEGRPERHAGRRCSGPTSRAGTSPRMFGQKEPDLIIQSTPWTQKAGAQRHVVAPGRRRPASPKPAGSARSKSGPSTVKGRKITHHAIARLQQQEDRSRSRRTTSTRQLARRRPAPSWNGPSASRAKSCARTPAS